MAKTAPSPQDDQLTTRALEHYTALYEGMDPSVIALRTGLEYEQGAAVFRLTLMGQGYRVSWPHFSMVREEGLTEARAYERILILRFLIEGCFTEPTGRELAYREFPRAQTYASNFQGRVIGRLLREFGRDPESLGQVMERASQLNARRVAHADVGYRFEFLSGFPMSILIWAADDEFPPSVQVLFDESFRSAFSAEDLAVIGDISINHLIAIRNGSRR